MKYELKIINARTNSIDETLSADDFYGLSVKYRQYYIAHPNEAQRIIDHAHEYIDQFRDQQRERLISLLVLQRYFDLTNK